MRVAGVACCDKSAEVCAVRVGRERESVSKKGNVGLDKGWDVQILDEQKPR